MRSSRLVLAIKPRNGDIVAIEMASHTCKLPSLEEGSERIQESHITIATNSDEITEANRRI